MSLAERARGAARALGIVARLPREDASSFAGAWWALLACRLRLRFPRALAAGRLLRTELTTSGDDARPPVSESSRLVEVFELAVRNHVVAASCLPRAVALRRYLRGRGVPSALRMGMRRKAGHLEGHVWVESRGRVVGDRDSFVSGYRTFRHAARS
jgi:Transglutaminase-like superfamily